MKNIVFIITAFLGVHVACLSQVTIHCPSSCRPVLSCNTCWESVQQAVTNGCGSVTTGNQLAVITNPELIIYPNPTHNKRFIIDNKNNLTGSVDVLDLRGHVVTSFNLNGENMYTYEGDLASGLYLIRLTLTGTGIIINRKLIVQ